MCFFGLYLFKIGAYFYRLISVALRDLKLRAENGYIMRIDGNRILQTTLFYIMFVHYITFS